MSVVESRSQAEESRTRLIKFLKTVAPFSIIEKGFELSASSAVTECTNQSKVVTGSVTDSSIDDSLSVSIDFSNTHSLQAQCACSDRQQMREQWCKHAVAVLVHAHQLGFLDTSYGFPESESTYRLNVTSPTEISKVLGELGLVEKRPAAESPYFPRVSIELDLSSDRLGIKVHFDDMAQGPLLFDGLRRLSSRALDNILIRALDDEGSWDEQSQTWFISSSSGLELALGLLSEYPILTNSSNSAAVTLSKQVIDARIEIDWHESLVELVMYWILPDGSIVPRQGELLGTGPYWVCVSDTLYRVSASAAKIASIFPYASSITLARSQMAPLLEVLLTGFIDASLVVVRNPEQQPQAIIKQADISLTLVRKDSLVEHFSSRAQVVIEAQIEFNYPTAPTRKNVIYIPDRAHERAAYDQLKSCGFNANDTAGRFTVSGDTALNFIDKAVTQIPTEWKVVGLEQLRKSIRFAELSLNVSLSSGVEKRKANTSGQNWFDAHVALVHNNSNLPISTLFKAASSDSDRWLRLDSGAFARVPGGSVGQLKTMLGLLDSNFKLSNSIKARLSTAQAMALSRLEANELKVKMDERLEELSEQLDNFQKVEQIRPSKKFTGKLRPYQRDGLSWLKFLHDFELGGILADEMGLGKTVQTLALLQTLHDQREANKVKHHPALVVAPTSVVMNWIYEARRFAPELKTLLLHGSRRKQHFANLLDYDVVVTSYALLRLDRFELEKTLFSYIVLDEAQNIKNPDAATTKAAKALRAERRLALSGTPTENRPSELWSIIDFLMPGYLGSLEYFRTYLERPILEQGPQVQAATFLQHKTKPFIMRRKKCDVEKDLPAKIESVMHVAMTESQRQLYSQVLEDVRPRVFKAVADKGIRAASISILAALLRLRQVCNHPNSIDAIKALPGYDSGKFNALKDLVLEALESGRKILLFSQFREMLLIIRRWLAENNVNYLYLDGASKNRQDLVDGFNNDPSVRLFLISLKAGGTGLNLTAADTVIIYDPWWNPAVESQAVDRAHRIGQQKTVSVYRLVTEDSVEQHIMALKDRKSKMVDALLDHENSMSLLTLTKTELESIFSPLPHE